jgi:tRNA threonylcarbamoyladenosine biosynthesis protein TsaB
VTIIALDTATSILSVALVAGAFSTQKEQWYFEIDAGQRHGELLMEISDQLIKTAGLKPGDIDMVVCMKGPGSFTGLRIGFAAAKGMALALGIPLLSVPTLDCMAVSYSLWPGMVIPVIDAKKQCYFTALYRNQQRLTEYLDAAPARIIALIKNTSGTKEGILLTGPDGHRVLPALHAEFSADPDIQDQIRLDPWGNRGWGRELVELAQRKLYPGNSEAIEQVRHTGEVFSGPLYVRKSDAELQKQKLI